MRNLTEVSLKNKYLVWYFIIVVAIAGIFSYMKLGRMEDPAYTVRTMVVSVAWPGATAEQMQDQITDKIEKKLQDTKHLDYIKSYSKPGQSVIYINLDDEIPTSEIKSTWHDVRNLTEDMKRDLPDGVYGPYYNDRFDDVYGSIYAITGEGYSYEDLRKSAEKVRRMMLTLPDVSKVELEGEQTERVYVEVANAKLAELGIPATAIANAINSQNVMTPTGMIDTKSDNVYLRVDGAFTDVEAIRNTPINANGRVIRLGDIATIERKAISPADPTMYYNGKPAIGIALSMSDGGNILTLGENLNKLVSSVKPELPAGMEIQQVADQPQVVKDSIGDFVNTLREAIIIVLVVSFISLGLRTGMVVAFCIPLVLFGVFCIMNLFAISLHKVSLGSLIIALGLLVDDEIIAVEMMTVQLEKGKDRLEAACYAFTQTAKPMLTGTLITCAGFIPVAMSEGAAAEFCKDLFPVISASLIISWIVSVMVAPMFGYYLIKVKPATEEKPLYTSRFYVWFRKVLDWFLTHRKTVLAGTAALFVASIGMLTIVPKEFFPPSLRPELIVEMRLPEGSSMQASQAQATELAQYLDTQQDLIKQYSYYVGEGAPRFVLTLEPILPANNYAQFVVVANDTEARSRLSQNIKEHMASKQSEVRTNIKTVPLGPPSDYPVMLRVSGYDASRVKSYARQIANRIDQDPNVNNVFLNWEQKTPVMHLALDQDKLRAMGMTGQDISKTIYTELNGATVAQYYAGDRTIGIQLRLQDTDRADLSKLKDIPLYTGTGKTVPLEQVAKISYGAEDGLIWRRDLKPTITINGSIDSGTANDATQKAYDSVKDIRDSMPFGYDVKVDGALENSDKSMKYLIAPVPIMILVIMTILMFQLKRISLMALTIITAPMGIIGVGIGMLVFGKSLGFVADLGILALSGMIIRNSVILIDQIEKHKAAGEDPWHAIIDSAVMRFRPIMLTALAAILGMVPLMPSTFWGPLAVAIASGLFVATILTLLVLPTMYAAWFKVKKE